MKNKLIQIMVVALSVLGAFTVSINTASAMNKTMYVSDASIEIKSSAASRASLRASRTMMLTKKFSTIRRQLTDKELKQLLVLAGFSGKHLKEAWAIAKRETNGRPMAHNKNRHTGDNSYGIFQINMIGSLGPARRDKFNLSSNNELFNALTNAKIAYYMSNHGRDWSSWHGINSKAKNWLEKYPS